MKDERIRLSLSRCQLVSHVSNKAAEMPKIFYCQRLGGHLTYTCLINDCRLLTSYAYMYSTHCLAVPHGSQLLPIITKRQTPGQLHTARQSKMTCKLLKKDSPNSNHVHTFSSQDNQNHINDEGHSQQCHSQPYQNMVRESQPGSTLLGKKIHDDKLEGLHPSHQC